MSVHITGAAGFLGRNVIEHLCQFMPDTKIIGSDINNLFEKASANTSIGNCTFHQTSFLDDAFNDTLKEGDQVIHLARTIRPGPRNIDFKKDIQENVMGTLNLFEGAITKGVDKFVFISSGGTVYGQRDNSNEKFLETESCTPLSFYGLSMLTIENYLKILAAKSNVQLVILRLSNLFGPYQQPNRGQGLVNTVIEKFYNKKTVEIWGSGESVRDYIFAKDVVRAIHSALFYKGNETIFNIGSGVGRTSNEVVEDIQKVLKKSFEINHVAEKNTHVSSNVLDINLAFDELKWRPETSWFSGIQKTIDYYHIEQKTIAAKTNAS